jgi:hypothetical protein
LFLLQDISHDTSLSNLPQDVGDQSQMLIVEAPESSSAENPSAQIRATPSAVEVNSLTHLFLALILLLKLAFLFRAHRKSSF